MLSLSLALLNLLPLPGLDGAHMLQALIDRWLPGTLGQPVGPDDLDGLYPRRLTTVRDQLFRRRVERAVLYLTSTVGILALGGGILEELLVEA